MSNLYALIEPAIVGGGVLIALGVAARRLVPRLRRNAGGGAACTQCSGCGGCGSGSGPESAADAKPIAVHLRDR